MHSLDILIQGLCLWLTGAPAGITGVIPDFHRATPAHRAVLTVPKEHIRGGACPEFFVQQGDDCTFTLNGSGAAGGVLIDVTGDVAETPDPFDLACIPRIQHTRPLRMRREYAPEEDGSRLAAKIVVTRGTITSESRDCQERVDSARYVRWSLKPRTGNLSLVLSNLLGGRSILVPLERGAKVTIGNLAAGKQPAQATMAAQAEGQTAAETAHWCLYFTMFEEAGCPGKPPIPPAPARPTARRTVPPHAHGNPPTIETIACSNSQYP